MGNCTSCTTAPPESTGEKLNTSDESDTTNIAKLSKEQEPDTNCWNLSEESAESSSESTGFSQSIEIALGAKYIIRFVTDNHWANDTILDLKNSIQNVYNIPIENQFIFIPSQQRVLGDYVTIFSLIADIKLNLLKLAIVHDLKEKIAVFMVVPHGVYYDLFDRTKRTIAFLNDIFPAQISLIIHEFILIEALTFGDTTTYLVNKHDRISTHIATWNHYLLCTSFNFSSNFKPASMRKRLCWNETFEEQNIHNGKTLYLCSNENHVRIEVQCSYFYDKNPIYLTVSKHATINELKRAFLSYFQCDINAKQKMSKYKHKFNDLESKLAGDYYINNDFTIELSTESIQLYTSYMKIKPEEMISSKQQSLLKHIWKRELHTYNATGTDRVFVIPSFEIQLIVTDEKDKSHFVISVNSDCSSLALYQSIAGKLNVDIRTLVLKRDSDEYIECNLIKSIESYSLFPDHLCVYYSVECPIKSIICANYDHDAFILEVMDNGMLHGCAYISVYLHYTIQHVKRIIYSRYNIPVDEQVFRFKRYGRYCQDHETLGVWFTRDPQLWFWRTRQCTLRMFET
eukprot:184561_1